LPPLFDVSKFEKDLEEVKSKVEHGYPIFKGLQVLLILASIGAILYLSLKLKL